MWLDIYKSNKCTQLFEVDIVRHIWASPKLCQIVMQIYTKNELSCKVGFLHVVFQSFQVGLVRHVHSYWKHQVSYISEMKLDINLIFFLDVLKHIQALIYTLFVSGNQMLSLFVKIMENFYFVSKLSERDWMVCVEILVSVFSKKCPFWPKSDTALIF